MSVRRTVVTRYPTPATRGSEDPQANPVTSRETMQAARRVVVKIGSSSLTTPDGLDVAAIDRLVDVLAAERQKGTQVVLVSSGAVAAGFPTSGWADAPRTPPPSRPRRRSARASSWRTTPRASAGTTPRWPRCS